MVPELNEERTVPCPKCGADAPLVWIKAPGMSPDTFWAGEMDTQLGVYITSRSQRDRILKEKNLGIVDVPEFNRRRDTDSSDKEIQIDHEAFREAGVKAYNDLKFGNAPNISHKTVAQVLDGEV